MVNVGAHLLGQLCCFVGVQAPLRCVLIVGWRLGLCRGDCSAAWAFILTQSHCACTCQEQCHACTCRHKVVPFSWK